MAIEEATYGKNESKELRKGDIADLEIECGHVNP